MRRRVTGLLSAWPPEAPRSERIGNWLSIVVFLLSGTGGLAITWGVLTTPIAFSFKLWWQLVYNVLSIMFGLIVISLANLAGRAAARHYSEEVVTSHLDIKEEFFTLYLRSFSEDGAMAQPQQLSMAGSLVRTILSFGVTEEQQLAAVLEPVGKMVAVGAPGQLLPYVGAKKLYLSEKEWREPVRELMQQARTVVITLGPSSGVIWELTEAIRIVPPERLLLIVPMAREQYEDFRKLIATVEIPTNVRKTGETFIRFTLPDYSGKIKISSRLQGLICFSSTWEATFIPLTKYSAFYNSLRGSLARAIRVFLQRLSEYEDGVRRHLQ